MLNEYDILDDVYDVLFGNKSAEEVAFSDIFKNVQVQKDFFQIMLNDKFVIKIERI